MKIKKNRKAATTAIDKLAILVVNGFQKIEARLDNIETRLNSIETRLDNIEARLNSVETRLNNVEIKLNDVENRLEYVEASLSELRKDVKEMKDRSVDPLEFEDLTHRVKYLEEKMGIESGK